MEVVVRVGSHDSWFVESGRRGGAQENQIKIRTTWGGGSLGSVEVIWGKWGNLADHAGHAGQADSRTRDRVMARS